MTERPMYIYICTFIYAYIQPIALTLSFLQSQNSMEYLVLYDSFATLARGLKKTYGLRSNDTPNAIGYIYTYICIYIQ